MQLAEMGRGRTSPNPVVGALLLKEGKIISEGFHPVLGGPHAERVAIESAGTNAYGSTLVCTLEPCRSYGRTPPCLDAILDAGIAKVIVGSIDPNPKVNGESIKKLRAEGVQVEAGVLSEEIAKQNESYFKFITTGLPLVVVKAAMTLDGKVSLRRGIPTALTGRKIKLEMHQMRAGFDSIMVGIETILSDNPRLTARLDTEVARQPARVVLDSRGRIPIDAAVVSTAGDILTFIATTKAADPAHLAALEAKGAVPLVLSANADGSVDLGELLAELGKRSITSLIVEGGPRVHTSFVRQQLADKYLLLYAPYLVGGADGLSMIEGESLSAISEAEKVVFHSSRIVGEDLLVEAYPARIDREASIWAAGTRAAARGPERNYHDSVESTIETELPTTKGRGN